jgi:NADH-quinone oxidoreductase subunit F
MTGKVIRPGVVDADGLVLEGARITAVVTVEEAVQGVTETKGKKYLFVHGAVANPGFVLAAYGTNLGEIIALAGGVRQGARVKAIAVGGDLGLYVTQEDSHRIILDEGEDGGVFFNSVEVLDSSTCAVDMLVRALSRLRETSCGKCPLCREGTYQLNAMVNDIARGKGKAGDLPLMSDMAAAVELGAFCQFGRTMARSLASAFAVFAEEIADHVKRKKCPAGVCAAFQTLVILPEKCTGCGECLDVCDEDAIEGKKAYIHMIRDEDCTKCGACVKACPEKAIVAVGAITPRLPKRLTRVGQF